jgi:hypothetical protein
VVLKLIGHDERHLSPARLVAPVIAANRDDLAFVLDHVRHSIEAVDTREVCDLFGRKVAVQVEVTQSNRLVTQPFVESDEGVCVARCDRPHVESTTHKSTFSTRHQRFGVNYRHLATMTSPSSSR